MCVSLGASHVDISACSDRSASSWSCRHKVIGAVVGHAARACGRRRGAGRSTHHKVEVNQLGRATARISQRRAARTIILLCERLRPAGKRLPILCRQLDDLGGGGPVGSNGLCRILLCLFACLLRLPLFSGAEALHHRPGTARFALVLGLVEGVGILDKGNPTLDKGKSRPPTGGDWPRQGKIRP
jgi:hypothetical protein